MKISAITTAIGAKAKAAGAFVKKECVNVKQLATDSFELAKANPKRAGLIGLAGAAVATAIIGIASAIKNAVGKKSN